jgi:hypothetical protein
MHLGDEEIQRWLHGEIDGVARSEAARHLEGCSTCRQRLEEAGRDEAEIFALLSAVDHPAPKVSPDILMVSRSATASWIRRAALIALAVGGAGVAYAAPGSPVPDWIRSIGAVLANRPASPVAAPEPPSPSDAAPTGGIAVAPHDRFSIRFASEQARGTAAVTLYDGPDIVARSVNGVARFMTDVDRLTVSNEGSAADYDIQVPRNATWVEVRVAGRRLLLKRGADVESDVRADSVGRYVLPLTRSER